MDTVIRVQVLDKAVCISHGAKTLRKGMNPSILSPAMGKIVGQTRLFKLCKANLDERKLWKKNYKTPIKNDFLYILLVQKYWANAHMHTHTHTHTHTYISRKWVENDYIWEYIRWFL